MNTNLNKLASRKKEHKGKQHELFEINRSAIKPSNKNN